MQFLMFVLFFSSALNLQSRRYTRMGELHVTRTRFLGKKNKATLTTFFLFDWLDCCLADMALLLFYV